MPGSTHSKAPSIELLSHENKAKTIVRSKQANYNTGTAATSKSNIHHQNKPILQPKNTPIPDDLFHGRWVCVTNHVAHFKQVICHIRNNCSFMELHVCDNGLHWCGSSSVDHLMMHVYMPSHEFITYGACCQSPSSSSHTHRSSTNNGTSALCVLEINMFQLYRIIKRVTSFRYEQICISIDVPSRSSNTNVSSPYCIVTIQFITCNKHDVYHMRCRQVERIASQIDRGIDKWVTHINENENKPPNLQKYPNYDRRVWRVSVRHFHEALQRFDQESFHTISIRQNCTAGKQEPICGIGTTTEHESSLSLCSHAGTFLAIRSRNDGMVGKVSIPVSICSLPDYHILPNTPQNNSSVDNACSKLSRNQPFTKNSEHPSETNSKHQKPRYNMQSVWQGVRFALLSEKVDMILALDYPNGHRHHRTSWLCTQFELKHATCVEIRYPPVTSSCWVYESASSSSDSDSG